MPFPLVKIRPPVRLRFLQGLLLVGSGFLAMAVSAQTQQELDESAKSLVDRIFGPQAIEATAPVVNATPAPTPVIQSRSEREQILQVASAFQQRVREGKAQEAYLKSSPEFRSKYSMRSWRKVLDEVENRMGRKIGESGAASLELRSRSGSVSKDILAPVWKCRFSVKFENGDGEETVLVTKVSGGQFAVVDYSFEARPFTPTVRR